MALYLYFPLYDAQVKDNDDDEDDVDDFDYHLYLHIHLNKKNFVIVIANIFCVIDMSSVVMTALFYFITIIFKTIHTRLWYQHVDLQQNCSDQNNF